MDKKESNMRGATCLWNRDGVYYFRIRIPDDLKLDYGKDEIRFSLKTSNKRVAVLQASSERTKVLREFSDKRNIRSKIFSSEDGSAELIPIRTVDANLADYVCSTRLRATLELDDEFRPLLGPDWRSDFYPAERDRAFFPALKKALANGDTEWIRPILDGHLKVLGLSLACSPEDYRTLGMRFLQTLVKEYEFMFSRDEGNAIETNAVAPSKALRSTTLTLDDLLKTWRDATERPLKTVQAFTTAINRFSKFIKGKSPELIRRKDILEYRDKLLAGSEEHRPLQLQAVKAQIDYLKAVFRRAVANEQISSNPVSDIPFDRPTVERKARVPFSPEEIKLIFSTPIFAVGELPSRGGAGEAAYWLPLLGLYTGARLDELGQLRTVDVKQYQKLGWYLDITPQAGKLKTKSSERVVPIHSELVRLGFIEYAAEMEKSGTGRIFPMLTPDKYKIYTTNWSKWFGRHLDSLNIKDRRKVFHSLRHGFKQSCRAAGIAEDIHDAITGHARGSVGRSYGDDHYPLPPLFKAIELLVFPDVQLQKVKRVVRVLPADR